MLSDHIFLAAFLIIFAGNCSLIVLSADDDGKSLHLEEVVRISEAPADVLTEDKSWTRWAILRLWKEREFMGVTPIHTISPPGNPHVQITFKNESASPTGSLKHRYAWALMMWALLEGHVKNGSHVIEASSGNTACSLGYMCKLLGLKFTAVVPDTIELVKIQRIQEQGGFVVRVPIAERLLRAGQMARETGGFFMNQFKNAFYAEEFHDSGNFSMRSANMMHEILQQLSERPPDFFIHPAGTGGTLSSIGRYAKKYGLPTQIVLADTQFSVYFDYVLNGTFSKSSGASQWVSPGMAGIGYGAMGPAKIAETTSLDPAVIDRVLKIPDLASTAAMKVAREVGIDGGTSTGVNFLAALHIAATSPSSDNDNDNLRIATILADSGKYYESTYLNRKWISEKFSYHGGLETYDCWVTVIRKSWETGSDPLEDGKYLCRVWGF